MLAGASNREHCLVGGTALKRYRNDLSSTEVLTGEGRGLRRNLLGRPVSHEIAAQAAGSYAQIDNVVSPLDRLEVVFNDDNRVAQIAKLRESREKAVVVACVQSDGRLVENIEDSAQFRPDLRGEADALGFTAGKRRGGAVEAEIVEADSQQETDAPSDLFDDAAGHLLFALGEFEVLGHFERLAGRKRGKVGDRQFGEPDGKALPPEPAAVARCAGGGGHEASQPGAEVFRGKGRMPLVEQAQQSLEGIARLAGGEVIAAEEQVLLLFEGEFLKSFPVRDAMLLGSGDQAAFDTRGQQAGCNASFKQRLAGVGNDLVGIEVPAASEAAASFTGAIRAVERERARLQNRDIGAAPGAGKLLGIQFFIAAEFCDDDQTAGHPGGGLDRVFDPFLLAFANGDPIHDDLDGVVAPAVEVDVVLE